MSLTPAQIIVHHVTSIARQYAALRCPQEPPEEMLEQHRAFERALDHIFAQSAGVQSSPGARPSSRMTAISPFGPRLEREVYRALQSTLIALGYYVGPHGADGRLGPGTATALIHAATGHGPYSKRNFPMDHCTRTALRRTLQSLLITMGFDVGPDGADGRMGPNTRDALQACAEEICRNHK